jgi:hypothetical protein
LRTLCAASSRPGKTQKHPLCTVGITVFYSAAVMMGGARASPSCTAHIALQGKAGVCWWRGSWAWPWWTWFKGRWEKVGGNAHVGRCQSSEWVLFVSCEVLWDHFAKYFLVFSKTQERQLKRA